MIAFKKTLVNGQYVPWVFNIVVIT